jgi:hypothetical protein
VLKAKKESLHPLTAKRRAMEYAKAVGVQFAILSNGLVHYFWDITKGNPRPIYKFPSAGEIGAIKVWNPDRQALTHEPVGNDYSVTVQVPDYAERAEWKGNINPHCSYPDVNPCVLGGPIFLSSGLCTTDLLFAKGRCLISRIAWMSLRAPAGSEHFRTPMTTPALLVLCVVMIFCVLPILSYFGPVIINTKYLEFEPDSVYQPVG